MDRAQAIDELELHCPFLGSNDLLTQAFDVAINALKQSEIIHCRDCKHYYFANNRIPQEQRYTCDLNGDRWQPDSFCSFAERRGLKMADIMTFPDTVEEFMEKYKIIDTERIYTNGTEMIPISRMRQWFDHESAKRTSKKAQNVLNSDLISRKAAIDALCSRCAIDKPETCSTIQKGDGWCDEVYTILNLLSAQPEQRWIPVGERLPDKETYVLISQKPHPSIGKKWCVTIAGRFVDGRSRRIEWRDIGFGRIADDEILAWMSLPEPYREEGGE